MFLMIFLTLKRKVFYRVAIISYLSSIAEIRGFSLRTLEKISTRIALVLASADKRQLAVTPLIICLCTFKVDAPELYIKAKKGVINLQEVEGFFAFPRWKKHAELNETWAHDLWAYCLGGGNNKVDMYMGQHRFHEKENVLPATCELIEGLKFPEER